MDSGYFDGSVRVLRPDRSRAMEMISVSSIVPSTSEWLDSICSIRVEPDRGRPDHEDFGSGAAALTLLAPQRIQG